MEEFDLVFVHGWSVRHTNTYGGLPERLVAEGARHGLRFRRRDIVLGSDLFGIYPVGPMRNQSLRSSTSSQHPWQFVLIGQTIDRKLYDNLNTYTGEDGSDGVVRVASANLNASHISLKPKPGTRRFDQLEVAAVTRSPTVAMRVVPGRAHSGKDMGIMRSVRARAANDSADNQTTIDAIMRCFAVRTRRQYDVLSAAFADETDALQTHEQVEKSPRFITRRTFIHDIYSQVIFRVRDSEQRPLNDFELLLTANRSSPNTLPVGFLKDRQCNRLERSTLTYYLNHNVMTGNTEIPGIREKTPGCRQLGFEVHAKPNRGFVSFQDAKLHASAEMLKSVLRANETVMVDIEIDRQVDKEAFRLERTTKRRNFSGARPSGEKV
ncbi:MAG: hypothetical protein GKR90_21800 [Pseudomonadales bacterium]|nr:hypothetical protein [Pseudomonadales bacterium]